MDGKDHYLGPWKFKASIAEYDRLIGEWLANGRRLGHRPHRGGDGRAVRRGQIRRGGPARPAPGLTVAPDAFLIDLIADSGDGEDADERAAAAGRRRGDPAEAALGSNAPRTAA